MCSSIHINKINCHVGKCPKIMNKINLESGNEKFCIITIHNFTLRQNKHPESGFPMIIIVLIVCQYFSLASGGSLISATNWQSVDGSVD